jgi:hypothetical protein
MGQTTRLCAASGCAQAFTPTNRRHVHCSKQCAARTNYARSADHEVRRRARPQRQATPEAVPTEAEIGWTAGFLDGEGHIALRRQDKRTIHYGYVVSAVQVTREPLDRLVRLWGGRIHYKPSRGGNCRAQWDWRLSGRQAADLLRAVLPYLTVKRSVALLMLMYADQPGAFDHGYRQNAYDRAERASIHEAMTVLNHRGAYAPNPA